MPLRRPTADTAILVQAAVRGLHLIYKPGYNFSKAGVHLVDLQSVDVQQGELALDASSAERSALMQAMDKINATHGKRSLWIASAGIKWTKREWEMRQDLRTPLYTTDLRDIPTAHS